MSQTNLEKLLQPHQVRVLNEAEELSEKITALDTFINKPLSESVFKKLSDGAKQRLREQLKIMTIYKEILRDRLGAFLLGEDG